MKRTICIAVMFFGILAAKAEHVFLRDTLTNYNAAKDTTVAMMIASDYGYIVARFDTYRWEGRKKIVIPNEYDYTIELVLSIMNHKISCPEIMDIVEAWKCKILSR